jgi:hypothetical protein
VTAPTLTLNLSADSQSARTLLTSAGIEFQEVIDLEVHLPRLNSNLGVFVGLEQIKQFIRLYQSIPQN